MKARKIYEMKNDCSTYYRPWIVLVHCRISDRVVISRIDMKEIDRYKKIFFNLYLSSKSLVQFVKNIFNFEIFVIFLSWCEWYWLYIALYRFEVKFSLILRGEREGHVLYFNIEHLVGGILLELVLFGYTFLYLL